MLKTIPPVLAAILFHTSSAWSDSITLPSETPTNAATFPITLSGCRGSSPPSFRYIGSETSENSIDVYAFADFSFFSVGSCYTETLEVGPFASGSYTINYYTHGWNGPFALQDSQSLTIENTSENEPALGRIIFSGEAAEDQVVTASHTISDRNGMGELHYQWYRNDEAIPWATTDSFLITDDDVGQSIHVTASFEDGLGNQENVSSLPVGIPDEIANIDDPPVGLVYIRGSVSVGAELTIDTSGLYDADGISDISYQWKLRYRAYSTYDQDIGPDSDTYTLPTGLNYYSLTAIVGYQDLNDTWHSVEMNVTGPVSPADRPLVTPPADITVPASGILTRVDPGIATAQDDDEGALEVVLDHLVINGVETPPPVDGLLELPPGAHLLIWTAEDSSGASGEGIQIVRVDPIIEFGSDLSSEPDGPIGCPLVLNGAAARYPVTVPYTLTGVSSAFSSEELLNTGRFLIADTALESTLSISNTLLGDLSGYTSLHLTMETPTNAVMGDKNTCQITLSSENFTPEVTLTAYQDEIPSRIVSQNGGQVVVRSTVEDLNSGDSHTHDWGESDNRLTDLDSDTSSFTFDPADMEPGLYRLRVRVSDGVASDTAVMSLRLMAETPVLTAVDSDGDGESDQDEGSGDSDADGIPDYLDPAGLPRNVLSQVAGSASSYLMQTSSGLTLTLGDIALFAQHHGALITRSDILDYLADGLGGEADADSYPYEGGLFDFRIEGLTASGAGATVVIPQRQAIAADSIYRKLTATGWDEFVVDENNLIKSAPGEAGVCPAPGDSAYTSGLSEGDWCVELTIEDGGPNDADSVANGRIADPGGVTTELSSGSDTGSGSGGGGLFNLWVLLLLALYRLAIRRSFKAV